MKTTTCLLLALLLAAGSVNADEPKSDKKKSEKAEKKAKPSGKSEQNVFQKTESSLGKWANDNKIWVTHPDKSGKKSEK